MTLRTACFAVAALAGLMLTGCSDESGSSDGDNGACSGDVDCTDGNECTQDFCSDGACQFTNLADGTACTAGVCSAGQCTDPGPAGCDTTPTARFADGDFAEGAWTSTEVMGISQGMRTLDSVTTVESGGNPGAYHRVQATLIATEEQAASIWVAHALDGAVYNPSVDGEICGFRFSLDGTDEFDVPTRSTFYAVFLLQNDTYYWSDRWEQNADRWETHVWTSNEFVRIDGDGPEEPDLSASGPELQFGYMTGSSRPVTTPDVPGTTVTAADNFIVEVFPPEP